MVEVLAEPNICWPPTARKPAFWRAENILILSSRAPRGGAASVTIEFKEYGVRLNFIPTITPRGTIRLQVAPEVSALDFTNAVADLRI